MPRLSFPAVVFAFGTLAMLSGSASAQSTLREGKDAFGKPVEREVNKRLYSSAGEQQ